MYTGLRCQPIIRDIAQNFPATIPQLLKVAEAIRLDSTTTTLSSVSSSTATTVVGKKAPNNVTPNVPSILTSPFCTVPDVTCVIPRGKMDIEASEEGIVIRTRPKTKSSSSSSSSSSSTTTTPADSEENSTSTVTILQKYVNGIFYVTTKDKMRQGPAGIQHAFIISLSQPVMIGKTGHSTITLMDTEANIAKVGSNLTIPCTRTIDTHKLRDAPALGNLPTESLSSTDQTTLLRRLFTAIFGKVGESDKNIYSATGGHTSIPCINKVNDGFLFPLRRAILFGFRPTICLPHTEIAEVRIGRGGTSSSRSFDLDIKLVDGKIHNFSMIAIEELDGLRQYVSTRTFGPLSTNASGSSSTTGTSVKDATTASTVSSPTVTPIPSSNTVGGSATETTTRSASSASLSGPNTGTNASSSRNMNEEDSDDGIVMDAEGNVLSLSDDEDDESYSGSEFEDDGDDDEEANGNEDEGDDDTEDETEDEDRDDSSPTGKRKRSKNSPEKKTASGTETEEDDDGDDDDDEDDDDDLDSHDDSELSSHVSADEISELMNDVGTGSSSSSSSSNINMDTTTSIATSRPKRAAAIVAAKAIDMRLETLRNIKENSPRGGSKKMARSGNTEENTE